MTAIDAAAVGELARELVAADGPFAGIRIVARVGTPVRAGDVLAECAGTSVEPAARSRARSPLGRERPAAAPARPARWCGMPTWRVAVMMERSSSMNGRATGRVVVTGAAGSHRQRARAPAQPRGRRRLVVVDRLGTSEKWRHLVPLRFAEYLDAEEFFARIAREPGRVRRDRDGVPPRRVLVDHRARRVVPDREQRAPLAGDRALGVRARRALRLRVVRGDVRRARERHARGPRPARAAPAQHVRVLQAPVRPVDAARGLARPRGRDQVLQRLRPQRRPQGHDAQRRREGVRADPRTRRDRAVQELSRRRRRRRADARLPVREGRRRDHGVPRAHAARRRNLQRRLGRRAHLERSRARGVRGARAAAADRVRRDARGAARQVPVPHRRDDRPPARGGLRCSRSPRSKTRCATTCAVT